MMHDNDGRLRGVQRSLATAGPLAMVMGLFACMNGCSSAPAAAELPVPKVTVAHPEPRELVDYEEFNGKTEAAATVEVRSRVRGHVVKVDFEDGDFVEKDELLFELDPRPFQSEIDRAAEQLNIATAQQYAAEREEARISQLFKKNVATPSEMEKAEAERKTWDARIAAAKEEVSRRELELNYSRVTAPLSGKISRAFITEGNLVNAGGSDPVMATIRALDPIDVYFPVDERSLLRYRERKRLKPDEVLKTLKESKIPFEFGLDTDSGFPHKGILDYADNHIDPDTATLEVRGKAENRDLRFGSGSRVRVRIAVSDPYDALLVPDEAILTDQTKKYVLCLNEKNVVVRRDIKLGKLEPDGMRVALPAEGDPGLSSKDWVVVLGLQRARVNYPVEPLDRKGEQIPELAQHQP